MHTISHASVCVCCNLASSQCKSTHHLVEHASDAGMLQSMHKEPAIRTVRWMLPLMYCLLCSSCAIQHFTLTCLHILYLHLRNSSINSNITVQVPEETAVQQILFSAVCTCQTPGRTSFHAGQLRRVSSVDSNQWRPRNCDPMRDGLDPFRKS